MRHKPWNVKGTCNETIDVKLYETIYVKRKKLMYKVIIYIFYSDWMYADDDL